MKNAYQIGGIVGLSMTVGVMVTMTLNSINTPRIPKFDADECKTLLELEFTIKEIPLPKVGRCFYSRFGDIYYMAGEGDELYIYFQYVEGKHDLVRSRKRNYMSKMKLLEHIRPTMTQCPEDIKVAQ